MDFSNCIENGIVTIRCIPLFIQNIAFFLFSSVGIVAVLYALYAGWKFIISRGEPIKVAEARKTLTFALIGLTIVIMSYFIIKILALVTGAGCISLLSFDKCK